MRRSPDFFIVGAPKCGTTALYEFLRAHPDIYMPEGKELEYFGSDLKKNPKKTMDEYLFFFKGWNNEKVVGEASVRYLYSKKAAEEIKEFEPNAKILIMVRNLVDLLYSYHSQELYNGNENIEKLLDAIEAEADRKNGLKIPDTNFLPDALFYMEQMKISDQIERYIETFGSEQVHIIVYDDFKSDIKNTYKKVLEFLDVNMDFTPEFKVINPNKKIRSSLLSNFVGKQPRITREFIKIFTTLNFRQKIRKYLRKINTNYDQRDPMSYELREYLTKKLAPEIDKISKLLDRDLSSWKYYD